MSRRRGHSGDPRPNTTTSRRSPCITPAAPGQSGPRSPVGAQNRLCAKGEDWFAVEDETTLAWRTILATVDTDQQRLGTLVGDIEVGMATSALADAERFNLVLGITCHAIYHAGQIQLIKRLRGE
jgi:hypothetical protein